MKPSVLKMRTVTAFAAITLSTGLLFTSCKKDKEDNEQISDEEVAEAITQSATRRIASGTSTIAFVGTGSGGYMVTRNATITFLGNRKATLVLKNGGTYNLEW